MENYTYKAINQKGKLVKGTIKAENYNDLDYKLQEIGLEIVNYSKPTVSKLSLFTSSSISTKDLILLCTHFEQLDSAGVPITEIISDLRDAQNNPVIRDLMQNILELVNTGKLLSEAMAEYPKIFDEVFVGLIASGEKTGNLSKSFNYLIHHLKWSSEISRKTKKAVRYPMFLLCVLFVVLSVMMTVVIPKLSEFLLQQNFNLPFYTKALIAFSQFFVIHWKLVIIIPIIVVIIHKIIIKFHKGYLYFIDSVILKLPFVGMTMLKLDISRFSQFFLITFQSGIEVLDCFAIVKKVVKNTVIKQVMDDVIEKISSGSSISISLSTTNIFPSLVIRMFEIGEKTGNMEKSLSNIKFFYDNEVNDAVDALVGIIQPALTLIMGGLLLWISLSVFGPLYSSFGKIS